jgi:hypothetical protein
MSAGHDDYASEPIPGLPERLPPGEHILWQGAPDWRQLAKDVFHIRAIALYFAALMAWRGAARMAEGGGAHAVFVVVLSLLPVTLIGIGLLALLAYLSARTTVYTITNRRVVMRIGVALPTAINIPFRVIAAADMRVGAAGAGDIPLSVVGSPRMGYANLWPHVRPWHLRDPEPTLRAIPDARRVALLLTEAVRAALPTASVVTTAPPRDHHAPSAQNVSLGMPASAGAS